MYPISNWNDGTNVGFVNGAAAQKLVGKPAVTFDLGGQFDLTTVDVWTEEQFSAPGTESVTISSSTDGVTFSPTTVADTLDWVDEVAYGNKVTIDVSSLPTGQFYKMVFVEPSQGNGVIREMGSGREMVHLLHFPPRFLNCLLISQQDFEHLLGAGDAASNTHMKFPGNPPQLHSDQAPPAPRSIHSRAVDSS